MFDDFCKAAVAEAKALVLGNGMDDAETQPAPDEQDDEELEADA